MVELSLKLLSPLLLVPISRASLPSTPRVHPMTPSLGVTPDEAQLPAGPQPTAVAIFGQFPVLWAGLSGEQMWGLGLPEEWVLGLDLSLGGPLTLLFLPYCCKYFNKMEKEKKKTKKKVRKSHHLKPPGTCSPGQPGLSPEQSSGSPGSQDFLCVHPSQGGQPSEQLFTLQRQNKSRSNSETKNLSFPAPVLSPLLCPPCISQPSWGVYLTACPRARGLSPLPTGQETSSHPKMLLPRWLHYPL